MRGLRWAISGFALLLSIGAAPSALASDAHDVAPAHKQAKKNKPPKVHLSAPEHRYIAPGSIPLTAEVTDRDDPIAKVEFFNGDTRLATLTAAPYTFSWTNVAVGNYELRAKATDARGATGTSNAFRVRVRDNVAPHVQILVPGNNATFAAPASIPVSLRANDRDDNLTSVELLANGTQLATFSAAPYEFSWTDVPPGTYALTARATDELGLTTTSRTVTVQVTGTQPNVPPTVSLTSPANNASFTAPASIPLTAAAADSDGTISKVEFFYGSTLIATSMEAPYGVTWTGVPEGTYALTALATDNLGAAISSSAINITVAKAEPKLYFIHVDHLNTPRLVADEAQRVVWRWDQQEPFGANLPDESPTGLGAFDLPMRFPGQNYDKETGLYYSYFRDFDPTTGAFYQSDPIGLAGGLNTYLYAFDPLTTTDPFGLMGRGPAGNSKGGSPARNPNRADCGPQGGFLNPFVPNNPLTFPFLPCCDAHDKCYDNCQGPDKLGCDMQGCACFLGTCKSYAGYVQTACRWTAQQYCYQITYSATADEQFRKARSDCIGKCKP